MVETFTELDTPTSQFYHVSVDNEFPYNIMGLNRTILPFVSLLDLVAIAVLNLGMPLQVAKQDISKPTQRMLTLHTVASTMAN
jgi:hypothetical protein